MSKNWGHKIGAIKLGILNPLFLLLLAALLFALSFPGSFRLPLIFSWLPLENELENGLPALSFVFPLPLLHALLRLKNLGQALFHGAFYGLASYMLLSLWLLEYDWIAFILVSGIYFYYFSVFFAGHFLAGKILQKYHLPYQLNYLTFALCWLLLEYTKSTGWVAYTYGSLLYSHYLSPRVMHFSGNFLLQNLAYLLILAPAICVHGLRRKGLALLCSALAIGILNGSFATQPPSRPDTDSVMPISRDKLNVALVQHNINSWQTEEDTSRQALERLLELSRRAERANAELIIWSETAFVPIYRRRNPKLAQRVRSLEKQLERQPDAELARTLAQLRRRHRGVLLSHELQDYLNRAKATYLIGTNDNGQFPGEKSGNLYNSLLLIQNGEILASYRKQRLVPFTEEARFEKWLPRLNDLLRRNGFAQYSAGTGSPIIRVPLAGKLRPALRIFSMICYEDSLPLYWPQRALAPEPIRQALRSEDFDILLSVSNDSWSPSAAGGLQHLSSSLSRALELDRYFLRGSTSGQTTAISPQGQILKRLPANASGVLYFRLPLDEL